MTPEWPMDKLRGRLQERGTALGCTPREISLLQGFLRSLHESCVRTGQDSPAPQVDTDGGELALAWFNVKGRRSLHISVEGDEIVLSVQQDTSGNDHPTPSSETLDSEIKRFFSPV